MSALESLSGYLAEIAAAERKVHDLEWAMTAQRKHEGRVAPITARAHRRAQHRFSELEQRLQGV